MNFELKNKCFLFVKFDRTQSQITIQWYTTYFVYQLSVDLSFQWIPVQMSNLSLYKYGLGWQLV